VRCRAHHPKSEMAPFSARRLPRRLCVAAGWAGLERLFYMGCVMSMVARKAWEDAKCREGSNMALNSMDAQLEAEPSIKIGVMPLQSPGHRLQLYLPLPVEQCVQ